MNDLQITSSNLPAQPEELAKFILVGREKLVAVRAEIRAIEKVGLAQEVRVQKLREAQDISDAVLDAEVRIGELMSKVPKASGGDRRSEAFKNDTAVVFEKAKADVIRDAGLKPWQVQRFQTMAAHPELVAEAKAEARENDDIVTRDKVLGKVQAKRQEEERKKRAEADERIEASRQSTQAFLDTVKRQHGIDDDNMVDLNTYQVAKREADYYREIADDRMIKALWQALKTVKKLPEDDASYESMWRGSIDPMGDIKDLQRAIERLTRIINVFIKKGDKNIDEVFNEMFKGDEGTD